MMKFDADRPAVSRGRRLGATAVLSLLALGIGLIPSRPAAAEAWEVPGILHTVHLASQEFGVSAAFMECVRPKEGGDNPRARGDGGAALGLWQFHVDTFRTAARLAGYPAWIANDPSWRADVTVSTRAAAALMATRSGPYNWTPVNDGRCPVGRR